MRSSKFIVIVFLAICCGSILTPRALYSQDNDTIRFYTFKKNQIGIDIGGYYDFSLNYSRRIVNSNFSVGGGFGFAFELNDHSFDRNIWEAGHIIIFARYQYSDFVQIDAGPTFLGYLYADDCNECSGSFVGFQTSASFGYKFVFVGPNVRLGWADDNKHGTAFGIIWNLQLRIIVGWGRS